MSLRSVARMAVAPRHLQVSATKQHDGVCTQVAWRFPACGREASSAVTMLAAAPGVKTRWLRSDSGHRDASVVLAYKFCLVRFPQAP